jgi:hypothetical protein
MKFDELGIQEFLQLGSDDGVRRFAGEQALLMNAEAMGDLRDYLTEEFGEAEARSVLTQLGFAQGWRLASGINSQFEWPSNDDWRRAGAHLGGISGIFRSKDGIDMALLPEGLRLDNSYEAEQQLARFGASDKAACWAASALP